ncbi:MAG TPA: tRNA (guanosine(37)-N1)-methyltransferase TrmD [Faecalibacter sp.]
MRIDIITVLPELLVSPFSASIMKRAQDKGLVEIHVHDLREYGKGKYRHVDDYPYGGTSGMVIMCEPLDQMISKLKEENDYAEIIYLTPDGETLNQAMANDLSLGGNLMMICGHYKGIDQRIRDMHVTKEVSIGDYVLSGGEFGAIILADAIIRLIPGVIGDETSALSDSFQDNLLAPPVYTRPSDYKGHKVPEVLLSGNFPKIEEWLHDQAVERTKARRPDLLKKK